MHELTKCSIATSVWDGIWKSRIVVKLAASGALVALFASCTGPQIHSDLKPDRKIMLRKWVISTHGPFDAGDHGTEYSNPIVIDRTLIFGNRTVGLVAYYLNINQQKWALPIRNGIVSEITENKGSLYFGGGDGYLYSVNLENGRVNWRYELRNPVISRPTVEGGRVFVSTSDDAVYALDAKTGKWLWHYRRRTNQPATIYGASAPLVDGNEVVAGLSDGFLIGLSLEEGKLKWEKKLHFGSKFTDVNAHPVLENGIVYIPSYDGALYAIRRKDQQVLWKFDAGGSKDAVIEDQKLYLPSSNGTIYALQKNNAKTLWTFELDHGAPTAIAVTDKYVIVGSTYQYLYVIDKNTGQGVYRFNAGFGSGFSGSPAFDPSTQSLYILSGAGNLYSFSLRPPAKRIRPHGMTDPYEF